MFLDMKFTTLSLVALATNAVLASKPQEDKCPGTKDLTIRTATGTYTGLVDPEFPNVRQWRSIAFAEPPVASRRWLPPQKLKSSPNERHYPKRFPPSCPQFVTSEVQFWNGDLTRGNLIYNGAQDDRSGLVGEATSEDCLYLAVWTPAATAPRPKAGLPVLFFMVGGGFVIGGVNLPWHMPTSWIERTQSHIVVSVNYRVNIFGFPNAAGLDDQNLGILDQRLALEWVRDNIASFGGDPNRIMQWGRSAGAISADIHSYAYHNDPIAQSYYMESGTALSGSMVNPDPTHSNFTFVADHFNCSSTCGDPREDAYAELDCLRQVPFAQISNFIGQYTDRLSTPPLSAFAPIADDRVVFSDYAARAAAGKLARRPVLLSMTANEFGSLLPYPLDDLAGGIDQDAADAMNIAWGVCPVFNSTVYRNRVGVPVYRFQYAGIFPNLNYHEWMGAYHNAETSLIFGTYGILDHVAPSTELQGRVSRVMQDHILAFAKDPWNGPKAMGWNPTDAGAPNGGELIRFGAGDKVLQRIDGVEVDGVCLGLREHNSFPCVNKEC